MASETNFREVDVLVVGAGPAGATAALNLARSRRVALIDLRAEPRPRLGESLPPAARRLFANLGIWDSFLAEEHPPCYGNRAKWGSDESLETDFLRDPDGHGWHVDRARFDLWLRGIAIERGATLIAPAQLKSIVWAEDCWDAKIETDSGRIQVTARVVIDAGGRGSPVARSIGARRQLTDKLVCSWVCGKVTPTAHGAGFTYVEAAENGWWYTAPMGDGRRTLAFHTDFDLSAARTVADPQKLLHCAAVNPQLTAILSESSFKPGQSGFVASHSSLLQPFAGHAWFAVGDAAFSFDPLSSQGLLNGLYTSLTAAQATESCLSGIENVLAEYQQNLNKVYYAYQRHLSHYYAAETRWSDKPFWQRRQQSVSSAATP